MCRFGHDVVRAGSRAFIASTQEGSIIELQLPAMDLTKTHQLFTTNNHVNSLAPLTNGSIWCLLHNRGEVSLLHAVAYIRASVLQYGADEMTNMLMLLTLQSRSRKHGLCACM